MGIYGLLQPIVDGLKLFSKEIIIPNLLYLLYYIILYYIIYYYLLYLLSPILSLTLALIAWGVVPYDEGAILSDIGLGILYLLAISSISVYVVLMSG